MIKKKKTENPVSEFIKIIPKQWKKDAKRVARATAKGAIEAGAEELMKIIDGGEKREKKKHRRKESEWD